MKKILISIVAVVGIVALTSCSSKPDLGKIKMLNQTYEDGVTTEDTAAEALKMYKEISDYIISHGEEYLILNMYMEQLDDMKRIVRHEGNELQKEELRQLRDAFEQRGNLLEEQFKQRYDMR